MATTPGELTDGTVAISESETVDGKYLLIKVPDFATDIAGEPKSLKSKPEAKPAPGDKPVPPKDRKGEVMTSFLRLGAAATEKERKLEPGYDLIQHAYKEGAGPVGFTGELELADGSKVPTAFIDDERNRGDGDVEPLEAVGHGMTRDQRYNWHTKHLESRGGWRDHSDGNRISTTYGDKLEVVRGNYKLIVMGRQDDPGNAQGHEWSGNHVQDWGQGTMPGASVTLEWIQNAYDPGGPLKFTPPRKEGDKEDPEEEVFNGGAWLLINSTERVYQYSRNAGNFCTQQWGDKLEAYVGSEDPERIGTTPGVGYKGQPTEAEIKDFHKVADDFPDDDDRSLVRKLRPSSFGLPRANPHMISKTWADKIESYTGSEAWWIPDMYTELWARLNKARTHVDTSDEETWFKTSRAVTHADSTVEEFHVSGELKEEFHVGSMVNHTYAGAISELTAVGAASSMTTAATITDLTFVGAKTDVTIAANQFELSAGIHEAIELAAVLDIFIGLKLEISAALSMDVNFGGKLAINCASSTEINSGPKLAVDLAGTTKLTTVQSCVSLAYTILGATVQIG